MSDTPTAEQIQSEWEEEKAQMAEIMEDMGAHPTSHNTGEKAMLEVRGIWQSLKAENARLKEAMSSPGIYQGWLKGIISERDSLHTQVAALTAFARFSTVVSLILFSVVFILLCARI